MTLTNHTFFRIRYYLSERFRLRFEDAGLEDMMDENAAIAANQEAVDPSLKAQEPENEATGMSLVTETIPAAGEERQMLIGEVLTIDGEIAGDEFAGDAINYQILLGKIDALLDRLQLDA